MRTRIDKVACTGCEHCVSACILHAISIHNHKAEINQDICVDCGVCTIECSQNAILWVRPQKADEKQ